MLDIIEKSMVYRQSLQMIYQADDGRLTKRRIKVLKSNGNIFQAYCFLRRSRRTFKINNVLALVPLVEKESMVV